MTSLTRALVEAATPYRPLITLETVATETPAVRATSVMVTRAFTNVSLARGSKTFSSHVGGPAASSQACPAAGGAVGVHGPAGHPPRESTRRRETRAGHHPDAGRQRSQGRA